MAAAAPPQQVPNNNNSNSGSEDDDWPSQKFRDHVILRLEPELHRNRQHAPNLPVPGNAKEVEEYVFQKCQTKDEYMRTIAKVINAINCNSKSTPMSSVLTSSGGYPKNGSSPSNGINPQSNIPPDPQPTVQQNNNDNNSSLMNGASDVLRNSSQNIPLSSNHQPAPIPVIPTQNGLQNGPSGSLPISNSQNNLNYVNGSLPTAQDYGSSPLESRGAYMRNNSQRQLQQPRDGYGVMNEYGYNGMNANNQQQPAPMYNNSGIKNEASLHEDMMMGNNPNMQRHMGGWNGTTTKANRMLAPQNPIPLNQGRMEMNNMISNKNYLNQQGYTNNGYYQGGNNMMIPQELPYSNPMNNEVEMMRLKLNDLKQHIPVLKTRIEMLKENGQQTDKLEYMYNVLMGFHNATTYDALRIIEEEIMRIRYQTSNAAAASNMMANPIMPADYVQPNNYQNAAANKQWMGGPNNMTMNGPPSQNFAPSTPGPIHHTPSFNSPSSTSANMRHSPYPINKPSYAAQRQNAISKQQTMPQTPQNMSSMNSNAYNNYNNGYAIPPTQLQSPTTPNMLNGDMMGNNMDPYSMMGRDDMFHNGMNQMYSSSPTNSMGAYQPSPMQQQSMVLPAIAQELNSLRGSFSFSNPIPTSDNSAYLIDCTFNNLEKEFPPIRLIVSKNYPNVPVTFEQQPLDIEAFVFEDAQNYMINQVRKEQPRTITDVLSSAELHATEYCSTKQVNNMSTMNTGTNLIDNIFNSASFDTSPI